MRLSELRRHPAHHLDTFEPIHSEVGSAAEQITKARSGARVVKAFNPSFAGTLMADQDSSQEMCDVFLAGDDVEAKRTVAKLFEEGGLRTIDAGTLRRTREIEALGYLYLTTGVSPVARILAGR